MNSDWDGHSSCNTHRGCPPRAARGSPSCPLRCGRRPPRSSGARADSARYLPRRTPKERRVDMVRSATGGKLCQTTVTVGIACLASALVSPVLRPKVSMYTREELSAASHKQALLSFSLHWSFQREQGSVGSALSSKWRSQCEGWVTFLARFSSCIFISAARTRLRSFSRPCAHAAGFTSALGTQRSYVFFHPLK